jgi:hypothetical protein
MQPGQQFRQAEGLGDALAGACRLVRGEQQDGRGKTRLLQLAGQRLACRACHVQQRHGIAAVTGQAAGLLRVRRRDHGEAFHTQLLGQAGAGHGIGVHQKDAIGHGAFRLVGRAKDSAFWRMTGKFCRAPSMKFPQYRHFDSGKGLAWFIA